MSTPQETAVEFLIQACCGTIMAIHRVGNVEPDFYKDQLVILFTRYFNNCWNSLLRGDDPFVVESFAGMKHNHPACVIKKLFSLGISVLPDKPLSVLSQYAADDPEHLEAARVELSNYLNVVLLQKVPVDIWDHSCESLSLEEERALWTQNGCPNDDFFVLS